MKWQHIITDYYMRKPNSSNLTPESLLDQSSVFTYNKSEEESDIFYNRLQNYVNYTSQFNTNLSLQDATACDVSDGMSADDFINYMKTNSSGEQPSRYKFRIAVSNAYILDALSKEESFDPERLNGNEFILSEEDQQLISKIITSVIASLFTDIEAFAVLFSDLSEEEVTTLANIWSQNSELNSIVFSVLHPSVLSRLLLIARFMIKMQTISDGSGAPNIINSIAKELNMQDLMNLDTSNPFGMRSLIKSCLCAITPGVDLGEQTIDNIIEDFSSWLRHYIKISEEFAKIQNATEEEKISWFKTNLWDYQFSNELIWCFNNSYRSYNTPEKLFQAKVNNTISITRNISDPNKYDVTMVAKSSGEAGEDISGSIKVTDINSGQSCDFSYNHNMQNPTSSDRDLGTRTAQIGPLIAAPQFEIQDDTRLTALDPTCFTSDTLITLYDGTTKRADEIQIGDELLCFDRKGRKHKDIVIFTDNYMKSYTDHGYYEVDFSGHKVKIIKNHRFYNVEKKSLIHIWDWKIGKDHALLEDGTKVLLTGITFHPCECQHHAIMTKKYRNYPINGVQSGFSWLSKIRAKVFVKLGIWKGGK